MTVNALYVIDTSSLVSLQRWRPQSTNAAVWRYLDEMIRGDHLVGPEEVYREIRVGKDALARWATRYNRQNSLFKKATRQHIAIAKKIIRDFPDLVDADRPGSQADPFVIALALECSKSTLGEQCVLITEEKFTPSGRPRIPHVCGEYKLPYTTIHQLYVAMGWSF